jgi:lipopolysaccharide biosynthesis glycosyltransferase
LAGLPTWGRAIVGMYQRMFVADVLPEAINRIIYLDGDLLFLDAIETLWNTDISGAIIGAVQDAVIPYVSSPLGLRRYRELGFQRTAPYFNAGVFIVDLDAWREYRVGEKAIDYLYRYRRSINLADQDVLNAVLHARWKRLPDRWNIIGGAAGRPHFRPRGILASRMTAALRKPAIIHFAGYLKPWLYRGLGSRWSDAYTTALFEVFPEHRYERSVNALSIAFYDRHLRTYIYPLERLAWRTSRHLR